MKIFAIAALIVLACNPALAINKCTDANGRISYQQQSCSKESSSATVDLPAAPIDPASQWRFVKEVDAMTGEITCFALSPVVYTNWGRGMVTHSEVFMQVAVPKANPRIAFTVRTYDSDNGSLFHLNIEGQGLKIEGGSFYPLTEKYGSHALGVASATTAELLGKLGDAAAVRLRLRFWPNDALIDTNPIPLANFKKSVFSAMNCAL